MITLLYGAFGSGKTTYILNEIKKDTSAGKQVFLIVPDQEAVQYERATLTALPDSAQLHLELMGFSRLYNRVCREYGGLSYRYVTDPVRNLLMWQNMRELEPLLTEYGNFSSKDLSICEVMLSSINECKACGIGPEQLEAAGKALPEDDSLGKRLIDLSLIYSSYDRLVEQNYSNSADDISRLYDVLLKHDFFNGCNVYIDSFTSFTAAEHKVIERIFASADNVTVTVPMTDSKQSDISCASIARSASVLTLSAKKQGEYREISLGTSRRARFGTLAHIADNLWRLDSKEGAVLNDGSIVMEKCDTPYAEAEAVSNHILSLLRKGERCRDILVLTRSPENYRGIIEPALSKNGIPFYFSDKSDLNSMPPVKLLYSALRINKYKWQKNDIITHVKTGLYSFSLRDADLFEDYIETWNINGSRFSDGKRWTMNPDGYVKELSPRGKDILDAANSVRASLLEHLEKFFILLDAAETVPDKCRAVYSYFTDIDLEDKLLELSDKELQRSNVDEAAKYRAVYGVMLNALADIAAALPEESVDNEEFYMILRAVFDKTQVGTIPSSVDEVMIGSAATARASNPKYTFVLGLCDGEFPAAVNDSGLFTSADRARLSEMSIELSSDADTRSSDELMYVSKAFSTPSHGLYLFTAASELSGKAKTPSMPFRRVCALLKDYEPHVYSGDDIRYLAGAPRSAAAHLRTLSGSTEGETLRAAISNYLPEAETLCVSSVSANKDLTVSKETVNAVHGNVIRFSSSKFERYVNCPMSYYCSGVLKLREKVSDEFVSSDMGTFVHAILEELIKFATTKNENGEFPTDDEITLRTEDAVLRYIDIVVPSELKRSRRLRHIYKKLEDLAKLMVRNIVAEFSASKFFPAFFELSIDRSAGSLPPLEFSLSDGSKVVFEGKIDRVDLYRNESGLYVRVVDYKTGAKVFSLDDVSHGINTQMLLYLFMLCKDGAAGLCSMAGEDENSAPIPAGIMYLSADIPTLALATDADEESVLKKAEESLHRTGLLLNDPDILSAMNKDLSRRFLAGIYQKKDGSLTGGALTSSEDFERLYSEISETVKSIIEKLRQGNAGATPLRYGKNDPCEFCKMKPVCRRDDV